MAIFFLAAHLICKWISLYLHWGYGERTGILMIATLYTNLVPTLPALGLPSPTILIHWWDALLPCLRLASGTTHVCFSVGPFLFGSEIIFTYKRELHARTFLFHVSRTELSCCTNAPPVKIQGLLVDGPCRLEGSIQLHVILPEICGRVGLRGQQCAAWFTY